jgi:FtsP/CotA-like multicopper oxidase with cupredoxin domain
MIWIALRRPWLLIILVAASSFLCAAEAQRAIAANDNRFPAGELRNGVLSIRLELDEGQWHPESEDGEAFTVYAFGETGRGLLNPGPLIRVPQDTGIHAMVHNALPVTATVHGLHSRPGNENDAFVLQPGATREVSFKAGAPGSYFYWATTTGSTIEQRRAIETQLAGGFIIDPPGVVAADRVFVMGVWYKGTALKPGVPQLATVNGKEWPYAERVTVQLGESVHWRWLNPSPSEHAMHLHGFYYHLDAVGDGEHYRAYGEGDRPLIVTQLVESGETFDMTWEPARAGRWLFHCHMLVHMSPPEWGTAGMPAQAATNVHQHDEKADLTGMGGLVLGITVVDKKEGSQPAAWHAERKLQLNIKERPDGRRPLYAVELRDPAQAQDPKPAIPFLIGPPIILTRGQAVEIEVINGTKQPTAIHWHGIELESYYDGVAGWTGTSEQTTPAIQPGESFVARMAPPRAGTFIYHTHWHDADQLENGIYGALIVLPPGQKFDPATDKTFVFGRGVFEPFGPMVLINGRPQAPALQLATRTRYRFRLINIQPSQGRTRASLRRGGAPVRWRIIAKDGVDLPPAAATMQTAELGITVGETYDFEYEATTAENLALEVLLPRLNVRATQGLVFTDNRPNN